MLHGMPFTGVDATLSAGGFARAAIVAQSDVTGPVFVYGGTGFTRLVGGSGTDS